MAEGNAETPKPPERRYKRFDSMKEHREAKQKEKSQKGEASPRTETRRKEALQALSRDKPEVADRTDLENLASAGQQTVVPGETTAQVVSDTKIEEHEERPQKGGASPRTEAGGKEALQALPQDTPEVSGKVNSENSTVLDDQPEIITPRQKILDADEVRGGLTDKWVNTGTLNIENDQVMYTPAPKGIERGIELAIRPDPEVVDPQIASMVELKKIPSPIMWAILEADPDSSKMHPFKSYDGQTAISADYYHKPVFDEGAGKYKEGKVMYAWGTITVDRETLVSIQQKTLEYLERQVKEGEMPQAILDAAKGILRHTNNAPKDPHVEVTDQKRTGDSPQDPKVERKWWKLFASDKWSSKGRLGQNENYLYFQDEKLKKQNRQRQITIATLNPQDKSGQNLVLSETAWSTLMRVPSPARGYADSIGIATRSGYAIESSEKPVQDKKGRWRAEAKPLSTDSQTLDQMQKLIRSYVEKQVADGRMDTSVLAAVDGILKYKHGTLEPYYDGGKLLHRIKGKERRYVERREPTVIDKIAEQAKKTEGVSSIEMTDDDIRKYLSSKNLPAGASIKNLNFEFNGDKASMTGIVDVPIPFVGGKINFRLELANNPEGTGLTVTKHHVDTKSGSLKSRLGELESNLSNINSFIIDDINEQLQFSNPMLKVQGMTIISDGNFAFRVQNTAPAVAQTVS